MNLAVELKYGKKFAWNASSKEGFTQIKASIDFLTTYDTNLLKIWHDFRWDSEYIIEDKTSRTDRMCNGVKNVIQQLSNYKEVEQKNSHNKMLTKFIDIRVGKRKSDS